MLRITEKYEVTHIVVCADDLIKATWFYRIAGLEWADYLVSQDSSWEFTHAEMQTMIAKLLENRDTGFTLIYEDEEIRCTEWIYAKFTKFFPKFLDVYK